MEFLSQETDLDNLSKLVSKYLGQVSTAPYHSPEINPNFIQK